MKTADFTSEDEVFEQAAAEALERYASPGTDRRITTNARVHILAQYVWPDDSACGLYAEHLAQSLSQMGGRVALVGGVGRYRSTCRPRPDANIVRLDHFCGTRGNLVTIGLECRSLLKAFKGYIRQYVNGGDVVILGSFPPNTVQLAPLIQERGAAAVYWLQDYYPELLRSLCDYPAPLRRAMARRWDRHLSTWDYVVKSSGNLAYDGPNARVIRNWNSVDPGRVRPFKPKTALYSGGLGYAHGVKPFIEKCESLRDEGFEITVRGDGPGFARLPKWIRREAPLLSLSDLVQSYWEAEVHLVAADPRIRTALFPSKFWNARATGRRVECSGFEGEMADELEIAQTAPFHEHRQQWIDLVTSLL